MSRIKPSVFISALVLLAMVLYLLPLLTPKAIDIVKLTDVPQPVLDKAQGHISEQGIWYEVDPKTNKGYLFISAGKNSNLRISSVGGGGYIPKGRKMSISAQVFQPENPSADPEDYLLVYSFSGFRIKVIDVLLSENGDPIANYTWNP